MSSYAACHPAVAGQSVRCSRHGGDRQLQSPTPASPAAGCPEAAEQPCRGGTWTFGGPRRTAPPSLSRTTAGTSKATHRAVGAEFLCTCLPLTLARFVMSRLMAPKMKAEGPMRPDMLHPSSEAEFLLLANDSIVS